MEIHELIPEGPWDDEAGEASRLDDLMVRAPESNRERGNTSFEDFWEYMADQRHDDAADECKYCNQPIRMNHTPDCIYNLACHFDFNEDILRDACAELAAKDGDLFE